MRSVPCGRAVRERGETRMVTHDISEGGIPRVTIDCCERVEPEHDINNCDGNHPLMLLCLDPGCYHGWDNPVWKRDKEHSDELKKARSARDEWQQRFEHLSNEFVRWIDERGIEHRRNLVELNEQWNKRWDSLYLYTLRARQYFRLANAAKRKLIKDIGIGGDIAAQMVRDAVAKLRADRDEAITWGQAADEGRIDAEHDARALAQELRRVKNSPYMPAFAKVRLATVLNKYKKYLDPSNG